MEAASMAYLAAAFGSSNTSNLLYNPSNVQMQPAVADAFEFVAKSQNEPECRSIAFCIYPVYYPDHPV
jgi:hypothetical protein